jgi:AraC family transcriptional activator of mtrCDE
LARALTGDGLPVMVVAARQAHYILLVHSMLWEIGANGELAMLSRRKTYAGRIKHPDDATEPATLDPLSAIAPLFRARPEIQDVCRFALQWEVVHEAEPTGFAQFHIVTNGSCLLERYCGETFKLEAGSILLLPQGDSHVVRSASRGGSSGAPIRTEYNNAIRIKTNTRDASDTELICGRLRFDGAMYSLVTAALPKAIVLNIGGKDLFDRMRMLVQAIDEELQAARPGAATIATELATALFVMMLRLHFEQSASSSGIIRLLASSSSARAVTAMLRAPAHPWTLDELAAEAHVSRATLVRIFRREGDIPPLGLLSELRLGLARYRLGSTTGTLAQVAAAVGYDSESAFARAFRKRYGISPGRLRARHDGRSRVRNDIQSASDAQT